MSELKLSVENLERERDFYYNKLREVEVLCQTHEEEQIPFLKVAPFHSGPNPDPNLTPLTGGARDPVQD